MKKKNLEWPWSVTLGKKISLCLVQTRLAPSRSSLSGRGVLFPRGSLSNFRENPIETDWMIDWGLICDLILTDLTGDTYYFSTQLFFFLNYSPSVTFSSCLLSFNLFSKLFFPFTLPLDHSVSSTPSFIILRLVIFLLSCSMLKQVIFYFPIIYSPPPFFLLVILLSTQFYPAILLSTSPFFSPTCLSLFYLLSHLLSFLSSPPSFLAPSPLTLTYVIYLPSVSCMNIASHPSRHRLKVRM